MLTLQQALDLYTLPAVRYSCLRNCIFRLDRLEPFERILVKSAAVIGGCTSRKMLKAIVPGFGEEKFRRSIHQLMLSHVFECASKVHGISEKTELIKKPQVIFVWFFLHSAV